MSEQRRTITYGDSPKSQHFNVTTSSSASKLEGPKIITGLIITERAGATPTFTGRKEADADFLTDDATVSKFEAVPLSANEVKIIQGTRECPLLVLDDGEAFTLKASANSQVNAEVIYLENDR